MAWSTEFDAAEAGVPSEVLALVSSRGPLVDWSWHNDVAPSFVRFADADNLDRELVADSQDIVRLWVHPTLPEHREWPESPRFIVANGEGVEHYEGDDIGEALRVFLALPLAALKPESEVR